MKVIGNSSENLEKVNQESENLDIGQKLKNVVVDDEAEIEQEDQKSDDIDECDNEREESDGGVNHNGDSGKEGDEVDVGEEDKADGGKDADEMDLVKDDKVDSERDEDEVDVGEEDKAYGDKYRDHSDASSHENADSVNKVEESDEGPSDQNKSEKEQKGLNDCSISQPESQLGGDESREESANHSKSGNGEETTQRGKTTIECLIYEGIPSIGRLITESTEPSFPRMLKWQKKSLWQHVDPCGDGRSHHANKEVHHFLVPTNREIYQPFVKDFVPLGQDFPDKN
ncbi:hypothetical protein K7X08_037930 [Anisodus acutangulus]|uniref:Uncharacterized protein n=1 Tax=Anisodus acutangulus TaxID=402998 RepID=A0A9Q1RT35_9SOLA|nr:hypothetical protein K7X08_037930 [Anisodus acutangulus]